MMQAGQARGGTVQRRPAAALTATTPTRNPPMKRRRPTPSAARISTELDFQRPTSRRDVVRGKTSTDRRQLRSPATESVTRARNTCIAK